jgi:hypothetical protein
MFTFDTLRDHLKEIFVRYGILERLEEIILLALNNPRGLVEEIVDLWTENERIIIQKEDFHNEIYWIPFNFNGKNEELDDDELLAIPQWLTTYMMDNFDRQYFLPSVFPDGKKYVYDIITTFEEAITILSTANPLWLIEVYIHLRYSNNDCKCEIDFI